MACLNRPMPSSRNRSTTPTCSTRSSPPSVVCQNQHFKSAANLTPSQYREGRRRYCPRIAMEVDRTFSQWSMGNPRIKWSAVFAGWAVGLALQTVLTLAGLGFGAWAIDPHDANPIEGIPAGAAVWTGLSMLLSAFIGDYLTARVSGSAQRGDGVYHGVVVWGV